MASHYGSSPAVLLPPNGAGFNSGASHQVWNEVWNVTWNVFLRTFMYLMCYVCVCLSVCCLSRFFPPLGLVCGLSR